MTPELNVAFVTYVIPALVTALILLRQRRYDAEHKEFEMRHGARVAEWDMSREFRDELRSDNIDLRCRLSLAEQRVKALRYRVDVLTDTLVRHGVAVPDWAQDDAAVA
jgi:hypothetical protein